MIKRILVGVSLLAAVVLPSSPAYATGGSSTVHVVGSPDDGTPPWARDTFDRRTTVATTSAGFAVAFVDDGTFRTPAGIVGKLHGEGAFTITGGTKKTTGLPHGTIDRSSVATKDSFTGEWWKQFVDGGTQAGFVWKWTYRTACETRTESSAGGVAGAYPSKACTTPTTGHGPNDAKPCEAYVYFGTRTNLCDAFPGADRTGVTCEQVGYRVQLRDRRIDPWGLDGSGGGTRGHVGLGCEGKPRKPVPSHSTPSTTAPTTTATATAGAGAAPTTTAAAVGGPSLPLTGPPTWALSVAGAGVLLVGAVSLLLARRRRARFQA